MRWKPLKIMIPYLAAATLGIGGAYLVYTDNKPREPVQKVVQKHGSVITTDAEQGKTLKPVLGYGSVLVKKLEIRDGCGSTYEVLGTVRRNKKIPVTGRVDSSSGIWYNINYRDRGACIRGDYIYIPDETRQALEDATPGKIPASELARYASKTPGYQAESGMRIDIDGDNINEKIVFYKSEGPDVLFSDDFSGRKDWKGVNGRWSIRDGRLNISEVNYLEWNIPLVYAGSPDWSNYTLETDFTPTGGDGVAYIVIGNKNITPFRENSETKYRADGYLADIGHQGKLTISRNGELIRTCCQGQFMLYPNETYTIKFGKDSNALKLKVWKKGLSEPGWHMMVDDNEQMHGRIVLGTFRTDGVFDNVKVYKGGELPVIVKVFNGNGSENYEIENSIRKTSKEVRNIIDSSGSKDEASERITSLLKNSPDSIRQLYQMESAPLDELVFGTRSFVQGRVIDYILRHAFEPIETPPPRDKPPTLDEAVNQFNKDMEKGKKAVERTVGDYMKFLQKSGSQQQKR